MFPSPPILNFSFNPGACVYTSLLVLVYADNPFDSYTGFWALLGIGQNRPFCISGPNHGRS